MKQKFETKPSIKETLRKAKTKDNRYKNKKNRKKKKKENRQSSQTEIIRKRKSNRNKMIEKRNL